MSRLEIRKEKVAPVISKITGESWANRWYRLTGKRPSKVKCTTQGKLRIANKRNVQNLNVPAYDCD